VFTNSTGAAPTIFAPTTLAGTGGYILATNAAKTGLEWVAKPAANVTTTAIVGSSATATT
jgi:ethanolamine transporter EutH